MAVAMDNAILENILRQVRPLIGQGKVADYIPALATVDGSRLGIAICTVDGQLFQAGDAQERFSIQSISKVLSLVVAMRHYSEEEIWQRVGKDPSGSPFNSLVQLEMEQGIPRNPFINAGALVVCDMLQGRLSAPRQRMLEVVRGLSGVSDISYDTVVARSEFEHSARNAAIAWLMKSFGNFHHDVTTVLQNYFHYCALKMSCVELARTFVFLANQGKAIHIDEPVVTPMQARQINALMATSGMYQNAGEFAWRVGLPAKSGVGGGIVAIVPHEMAIAVWSPELDDAGNSLAGIFPVLGGTGIHISDLKLAMGLNASKGKKTAIDKIYPRHFLATAKVLKFPEVQMHEILSDFARMIPAALDNVKTSLPTDFPENVVTAVETNVLRLHDRLSREYGIK